MPSSEPGLSVEDLTVEFSTKAGVVKAVSGVSFHVRPRETLGVIGESGSGKSVTALALLRLIPMPPGRIRTGRALLDGHGLLTLPDKEMRQLRGNRISMIFQEPMTSLNPVFTVGAQVAEVFRIHRSASRREALDLAADMLTKVGIPEPRRRLDEYPHQLSGGMRQRVMIAMALGCRPTILLADEPTTALDVTIQAQIVDLLKALQADAGTGILLISHDLGLVAEMSDRVAVMYAGEIVEMGTPAEIISAPLHPYTRGLLRSLPRLRRVRGAQREARLPSIPGIVPNLARLPAGCPFRPRCSEARPECAVTRPTLARVGDRSVGCWLYGEPAATAGAAPLSTSSSA